MTIDPLYYTMKYEIIINIISMTKQIYSSTVVYHTNPDEKEKFMTEIYKRYPSLSKFAKAVIANANDVFKTQY